MTTCEVLQTKQWRPACLSPTRGDTTQSRLLTGVFRPCSVSHRDSRLQAKEGSEAIDGIDVSKTGDSTWSLRDSKCYFIYLPSSYACTEEPPRLESVRPRAVTSYRNPQPPLRHPTSSYVILRHTKREYRVIANHRSASGLRLAPQLTHAPSCHPDGRGAGDITLPLGGWPTTAKLAVARECGALVLPALVSGSRGL